MANNSSNASPEDDPQFKAIMDAIDEVSKSASLNAVTNTSFVAFGPLSPEMQRKFVALGEMLDSFSRRRTR